MSSLATENKGDGAQYKNQGINYDQLRVKLELISHGSTQFESLELFNSASCDGSGGAGIGSWTISSSDHLALLQVKSSHLAPVNSSAVIPSRRRSCESLNLSAPSFSIVSNDAHGVSGFDLVDLLPTYFVATKRIYDFNSLVKEYDGRAPEELVSDCATEGAPNTSYQSASKTVIKEIHVSKGSEKKEAQKGTNVRARRAEELAIGHEYIFSCVNISRAIETRAA